MNLLDLILDFQFFIKIIRSSQLHIYTGKRSIKYKKEQKPSCPYFSIPFLGGNKFFLGFPGLLYWLRIFLQETYLPLSAQLHKVWKHALVLKKKLETYDATCLILMKEKAFALTQVLLLCARANFSIKIFCKMI